MHRDLMHKEFKWNGVSFETVEDVIGFVDENFPELNTFIREWFGKNGKIHAMTSGSTGPSKTIEIDRKHMINSARATGKYFGLGAGSKALLCLPLGYIAGRMMLVRAMVLGWQLDAVAPKSQPVFPEHKAYDFSAMVPMQLFHAWDRIENIRTLIVGGGAVPTSLLKKIQELKTKIFATYGMTETVTHVALRPLNAAAGFSEENDVFTALPGVRFEVDQRQCLMIHAPGISFEKVITNDLVTLFTEQTFQWIARADHIINSGGVKLVPELIEKKYENLIPHDFFVHGIEDKELGQKLVLIVQSEQPYEVLERFENYQKRNPEIISKFEVPRKAFFTKKFVRTETGKTNRKATFRQLLSEDQAMGFSAE